MKLFMKQAHSYFFFPHTFYSYGLRPGPVALVNSHFPGGDCTGVAPGFHCSPMVQCTRVQGLVQDVPLSCSLLPIHIASIAYRYSTLYNLP